MTSAVRIDHFNTLYNISSLLYLSYRKTEHAENNAATFINTEYDCIFTVTINNNYNKEKVYSISDYMDTYWNLLSTDTQTASNALH